MKLKWSKNKEIFKVKSILIDPATMPAPNTAVEYMRRGMAHYARKQYEQAETDLKHATMVDASLIDAFYGLGMVLKAAGRKEDAVAAFRRVLDLLQSSEIADANRKELLRRLALGHINELTQGDWNLGDEIWQRLQD